MWAGALDADSVGWWRRDHTERLIGGVAGARSRRYWTEEQKRAIVGETLEPGAVVAEVARRADVRTDLIYRSRKKMRARGELPREVGLRGDLGDGFARVLVAPSERLDRRRRRSGPVITSILAMAPPLTPVQTPWFALMLATSLNRQRHARRPSV
jgi:transposase-like protein